jgi:hypothetical protein
MTRRWRVALVAVGAVVILASGVAIVRKVRYEAWLGPGPGGPCAPLYPGWPEINRAGGIAHPKTGPLKQCDMLVRADRTCYLAEEPLVVAAVLGNAPSGPPPSVWVRVFDPEMWRYDLLADDGRRTWSRRPGPHPCPDRRDEWVELRGNSSTGDYAFVDPGGRQSGEPDLTYTEIPPWAEAAAPGVRYRSPIAEAGDYTLRVVYGGVPDSKATATPPVDPPEAVVSNTVRFRVLNQDEMSADDRAAYGILQRARQSDGRIWGTTVEQERAYRRVLRECPRTWYRPAAMYWLARCVAERDPGKGVGELLAAFRAYPRLYMTFEGMALAYHLVRGTDVPLSRRARRIAERTISELRDDPDLASNCSLLQGLLGRAPSGRS